MRAYSAVKPAAPPPEVAKADRLKADVARAEKEFLAGNLVLARRLTEDVLNEDSTNGNAKKLLAAVNAKMAEEEAKVAAAAAAAKKAERPARPAPPPVVERKVVEKKIVEPPKKAEPKKVEPRKVEAAKASEPAAPVDQDKLKGLIKAGRDAYNNGDFPAAIKAYNSALQMDRNNGLVQKLLEQARAKAGQ